MIESIVHLIALIVGLYWVFWKPKPEPFEPKLIDRTSDPNWPSRLIFHGGHPKSTREPSKPKIRIVDRTLDPNSPRAFIICSPWNGHSRGSTPPHTPKPPHKER